MNFGELNINELDKNKAYVCEMSIDKPVKADLLYAYINQIRDSFVQAGICNMILIPTGKFAPVGKLIIKENNTDG